MHFSLTVESSSFGEAVESSSFGEAEEEFECYQGGRGSLFKKVVVRFV